LDDLRVGLGEFLRVGGAGLGMADRKVIENLLDRLRSSE